MVIPQLLSVIHSEEGVFSFLWRRNYAGEERLFLSIHSTVYILQMPCNPSELLPLKPNVLGENEKKSKKGQEWGRKVQS